MPKLKLGNISWYPLIFKSCMKCCKSLPLKVDLSLERNLWLLQRVIFDAMWWWVQIQRKSITEVLLFVFLIGLPCPEIHVCGESSAINLVERLVSSCNDELEVRLAWKVFSSLDTPIIPVLNMCCVSHNISLLFRLLIRNFQEEVFFYSCTWLIVLRWTD